MQEVGSSNLPAPTILIRFLIYLDFSTRFATLAGMKKPTFPLKVSKQGVSVTIGLVEKNGQKIFRVLYREQGKRKQAWRSTFEDAKRAADDAIEVVLTGDASALKLSAADRHIFLRSVEILAPLNIALDQAARECADFRDWHGVSHHRPQERQGIERPIL